MSVLERVYCIYTRKNETFIIIIIAIILTGKKINTMLAPGGRGGGGGVLHNKRLMGMCHWMWSHFHDWIDYRGVAFSIDLLGWGRTFSDFSVHIYC